MTKEPIMQANLMDRFTAIVGERYALRTDADIAPFITDMRGRYAAPSPLVLRPGSVEEIAAILKLATETGTAIVPQGGNTGLVGGGLPLNNGDGSEVMLSLSRLNKIIELDADSNTMTVEAGVILENIQNAADEADLLFPLSLGAQGSCQIGGNIGTNAGGTGVLAYGNTRDLIMGLEAVLPTGEIWNGLTRLRKDNTGYDLKNLFIGGEGTLGVVTKAVLKLFPKPKGREVAYVALQTPQQALKLFNSAKAQAGNSLTAFEFMAGIAMEMTLKHAQNNVRRPIEGAHPWYVLMEISSSRSAQDARDILEGVLGEALENEIIQDAVLAESLEQQRTFWTLREDMSPAQKPEGASIKHDISVPVGSIPDFIVAADKAVLDIVPDARIVNFGHMGDGNLHYNISQPVGWDADAFFAYEPQIHESVYEQVVAFNGSISAEHGIGQMKRDKLARIKDPTALAMMRSIKDALDPAGIMNPGKVIG
ncbi:MAG: FAD-binding oxidoreductase [Hyphomicrobiales bacterium]|nr:FAD-binding oxidoreductase [Hyphomicrobiales bacterium]